MDATGAIQRITPESHPHLFRALGVSVGRLGLLLQLSFHIVPNKNVARSKQDIKPDAFVEAMQQLQKDYTAATTAGATATSRKMWDVLQPWNDRQVSGCEGLGRHNHIGKWPTTFKASCCAQAAWQYA
jgi:hypothetical protein